MIILTHIIIALAGIAVASLGLVRPTINRVRASYALIGATVVSGMALVVITSASILHACLAGFVYTLIVSAATAVAHSKVRTAAELLDR